MKPIRTFTIIPALPAALERLRDLAHNLRWSWDHDTIELFRRLDSDLWEETGHNPVKMLGAINQSTLEKAAEDVGFMAHLERVSQALDTYMHKGKPWFSRTHQELEITPKIAYFSAEFGVTECLSIFAGGLGVLAGDHLKSSSDLGVPLTGVGLLYQQGYFNQYLNQAGWQQEAYEDNDFFNLPLQRELDAEGNPLKISVEFPGRPVFAQIWRAQVGRVKLYLLDTNIEDNTRPEDRDITDQLYGGDLEMRIKQEIILGIGGYRALEKLGIEPTVYHMNEGHSAFLALEHIRRTMQIHNLSLWEAVEVASASLVFTTHTPVAAGQDYFPPHLMDQYFGNYAEELGLSRQDFLALGRTNRYDDYEAFCMTVLALRMASYSNGVSKLHGKVSRQMWQSLWPGVPEKEIPISHVTNGVHFPSWISRDINHLYDRYLGPRWREVPADPEMWKRGKSIAPEELWRTHERRRERLVAFVRRTLREQLERRGAPTTEIETAREVLDPEALTIGFARRFATYKRATLILSDPERLNRILNHPEQPVQIIFAGKAHPHDDPGKALIQQIVGLGRQERFRHRLVFIENYDMSVARYLLEGVDVWLNTPRRPREASGTSGMKAVANGVLNLSILDGWWDEAYSPGLGWPIGRGEVYEDLVYQDQVEAEALYDLLEREVIPTFYDRGSDHLPRRWITMMKANIETLCYFFNTNRMVREYTERFYIPTTQRYQRMRADEASAAKNLADWRHRIHTEWSKVRVESVESDASSTLVVGEEVKVSVRVHLGGLQAEDVRVDLYSGPVDAQGELTETTAIEMQPVEAEGNGIYRFEMTLVPCSNSGLHGYTARALPNHPDITSPFIPGYIVWA